MFVWLFGPRIGSVPYFFRVGRNPLRFPTHYQKACMKKTPQPTPLPFSFPRPFFFSPCILPFPFSPTFSFLSKLAPLLSKEKYEPMAPSTSSGKGGNINAKFLLAERRTNSRQSASSFDQSEPARKKKRTGGKGNRREEKTRRNHG